MYSLKSYFSFMPFLYLCLLGVLFLGACNTSVIDSYRKPDRDANLTTQDFRDYMAPRPLPVDKEKASSSGAARSSIPPLAPYIETSSRHLKSMPLVSISVNQTVPLRDVLFELAEQAEMDLELDPRIRGSIIFKAQNRPFDQVIERIANMAALRYRIEDDVVRVELDTPYSKTYRVDYLSYTRTNSGSTRNNIAVVSGDGADTGSTFEASAESVADFWGELEFNLQQILDNSDPGALRTQADPRITAVEQNPDVAPVVASSGEDGETEVQVEAPDAVLRVESLPVDEDDEEISAVEARFSLNRHAGLVNVFATEKQHKEVQNYLAELRRSANSQVLIEARVLEVTLEDEYRTGINWQAVNLLSGELAFGFQAPSTLPLNQSEFTVAYAGNDVQGVIDAISEFGHVRALASPRMTVLNNQSAVLNVATNRVYFEIDVDISDTENGVRTEVDSEIRNVPEGILVNVQPSVDLDSDVISMAVRPTVTRIDQFIDDPAVAFLTGGGAGGLVNRVPEVSVQEIDSVIQVRSGQSVVMGGLLQDRVASTDTGVPVLSEVPLLGGAFKDHSDEIVKTELVIFLKATILEAPGQSVHDTDKELYRAFARDRRPLEF